MASLRSAMGGAADVYTGRQPVSSSAAGKLSGFKLKKIVSHSLADGTD